MGACQSEESESAGTWGESPEFTQQNVSVRVTINKETGEQGEFVENPEVDVFMVVESEVEQKEFMAVKPWIGAVVEPTNHPAIDKSPPDATYELEYVYGYRCSDSRQNVFYNTSGQVVYMTACLGVVLDQNSNTQKFFGNGEVENKSKQVSADTNGHNNDILSLKMNTSAGSNLCVTGQVGKSPAVFVWDATSCQKVQRIKLSQGARGVSSVAISEDGTVIACTDQSNDNCVYVFDVASGQLLYTDKTGGDAIFDCCFSRVSGDYTVYTAGVKHYNVWDWKSPNKKKGLFGDNERTSFSCVVADDQGNIYTGGANSQIYVWNGNSIKTTLGFHAGGFVGALQYANGKLYSGGKDGNVCITNVGTLEPEGKISFGTLIRAIDVQGSNMVVGLRSGSIVEYNMNTQQQNEIMVSHNDGEVWGLDFDYEHVLTSGDDNQVLVWDPNQRKCIEKAIVNSTARKAKQNKASTLGNMPESQASRAICITNNTGVTIVGANDGSITIRPKAVNGEVIEKQDSNQWIEVIESSADGSMFAVGSHDGKIRVYDSSSFDLIGVCKGHSAAITCIDFSSDGAYIRSVCNAYELLFFTLPNCEQDPSGASNTVGTEWDTHHAKFGWLVDGIFPKGTDGSHINSVDMNEDETLIATGDDYGLVNLFRNPCRLGSMPRSFRAHSEHVVRVRFGCKNFSHWLWSVGGYDQTLMQWKKK